MPHDTVRRGSELFVGAEVRDYLDSGKLSDPDSITVTITRSDATVAVNAQNMTRVRKGAFRYLHQTSVGDPVGDWTADVVATLDGRVSLAFQHTIHVTAA